MTRHLVGHFNGRVVDRDDPEGLARVRVEVPGIFSAPNYSEWISPWGLFDATDKRGFFIVPKVRANIVIMFIGNDTLRPEYARYMCGPWGKPAGISDVPDEAIGDVGIPDPDISVMAFEGFALVVDERIATRNVKLLDRTNGSFIQLDIVNQVIEFNTARNLHKEIALDEGINIGGKKLENITGNKFCDVGGNDEKTVGVDKKVDVTGNEERTIGVDWKINVTGNAEISANGNVEVTATQDAVVNAGNGQKVELNVGSQTVLQGEVNSALLDGASEVKIGRLATDFVALKTELTAWLMRHTHPIVGVTVGQGTVVSYPPLAADPVPATAFSTKTKAE